jgi:myo-inositol-1(or 4)-monophosphatase
MTLSASHGAAAPLDPTLLSEIEAAAVDLAKLAGKEIVDALGRTLTIRYKEVGTAKLAKAIAAGGSTGGPTGGPWRDPVSEVDQAVEQMIRTRVGKTFADHDILGEEIDTALLHESDFIWAIDPIDGTANFINGFPLFAASIGVLHRGVPVAGAVWCSASHALYAGVYHARQGGELCFDGAPLQVDINPAIKRRLAGSPHVGSSSDYPWDTRQTGSAAIECAFVAAGMMRVTRFERPNVWDVAGGMALLRAAGADLRYFDGAQWRHFERFEPSSSMPDGPALMRNWRRPLLLGDAAGVALMQRHLQA